MNNAPGSLSRAVTLAHLACPCISQRSASAKLVRVKIGGSLWCPGSPKTVSELGAPPTVPSSNPNSRLGRASPHSRGRGMEHSLFVGIDVAKEHLDVHLRPTGEAFRVSHDDTGLAALTARLARLGPAPACRRRTQRC